MAGQYKKDGLVVLAVNYWDESKQQLLRYAKRKGLRQRILLNGSQVGDQYKILGIPTTLWIDREGVIVDVEVGFDNPAEFEARTKALVKG